MKAHIEEKDKRKIQNKIRKSLVTFSSSIPFVIFFMEIAGYYKFYILNKDIAIRLTSYSIIVLVSFFVGAKEVFKLKRDLRNGIKLLKQVKVLSVEHFGLSTIITLEDQLKFYNDMMKEKGLSKKDIGLGEYIYVEYLPESKLILDFKLNNNQTSK